MDDLIQEFLVESNENLDRLDSELVKLESDPTSADLLASIFRSIIVETRRIGTWSMQQQDGKAKVNDGIQEQSNGH